MQIDITNNAGKYLIAPKGQLDYNTMAEFDSAVSSVLPDASSVTIDMADVPYISSAGIRVIIRACEELAVPGAVKLINSNEMVREVFDMTGLSESLLLF